jgi:hypothetical protein
MGNFYTNYTLRGPTPQAVAAALEGRKAIVTPASSGCVVVFDDASEEQDQQVIDDLAEHLSRTLQCATLAVLNHDDDILRYQLYINGERVDEYDSSPGYFDPTAEPSAPAGGNVSRLCEAFGASDLAGVQRVLTRNAGFDDNGYLFAVERHQDLVRALGISGFSVGTSYASFESDELPEGLDADQVIRTG